MYKITQRKLNRKIVPDIDDMTRAVTVIIMILIEVVLYFTCLAIPVEDNPLCVTCHFYEILCFF